MAIQARGGREECKLPHRRGAHFRASADAGPVRAARATAGTMSACFYAAFFGQDLCPCVEKNSIPHMAKRAILAALPERSLPKCDAIRST